MHFEDATKGQLITICLHEDCDLDYKYQAARELQLRKWHDDMLPELIRLWGQGETIFDIAIELGIDKNQVKSQLFKYRLYGRRVERDH